ncbi:MAG: LuxR C-terminal-related transcriptional regulator [Acidimicrobiia bacterium]
MASPLERALAAAGRRSWADACSAFAEAQAGGPLTGDDLERYAVAAYLAGRDDDCTRAWEAAHRAAVDGGEPADAARRAVLLALCLVLRGQMAQAGGWLARAEALVAEAGDGAAAGYVLVPRVLAALGHDPAAAAALAEEALAIGRRWGDADLAALGTLGHGQALLAAGDTGRGVARLDEVMVSVVAGEVGPVVTGIVYCAVIIECLRLLDLARAAEWTTALGEWCDAQAGLVPYRGQCLVHRSQLAQVAGRWADAAAAAEAACRHLADPPHPALGLAHYQAGELHRLHGRLDRAEAEYRAAARRGHDPVPGLALLQLARGDAAAAATTVTRALQECRAGLERAPLLAAAVEIRRAAGDVAGARAAADELASVASTAPSPVLAAMAAHATGCVLAAEGDPASALSELRAAARAWQALGMPYDAARTAAEIAAACEALGDRAGASLERENARSRFAELGAGPDLVRLGAPGRAPSVLSEREREVLALVAAGMTNRQIGEALLISPHTAGRHVENIFAKLGVSTRAAATARAYELGLVPR